jgi:sarcosine oxidase subunit delta
MLLVPCPYCGPRAEVELHCGGEAHIRRPDPVSADDAAWEAYLFLRGNPMGPHLERWWHVHGCRRWFHAARDTVSDRFLAVYPIGEPPPAEVAAKPAP